MKNTVLILAVIALLAILTAMAPQEAPGASSQPPTARARIAICHVFGSRCAAAVRVARCESHLNRYALGSAGERGLFQIHPVHFGWVDERRLFEPYYNARIAYRLSRGGRTWRAWTCQP